MTVIRNSQTVVEVVEAATAAIRNTQTVVETVRTMPVNLRATQVVIEVVRPVVTGSPVPIWALTNSLRSRQHV